MKYIYLMGVLLLPIILVACKNRTESAKGFKEVIELTDYQQIYSDAEQLPLGEVSSMLVYENTLVTKHVRDEFTFSFFNTTNGELICRWGKKGNGVGEFISFGVNLQIIDDQLTFAESMSKTFNLVSMTDILGDSTKVDIRTQPYPYTGEFRGNKFAFLNGMKVVMGFFEQGRLGLLSKENDVLGTFGDYPFHYDEITGIHRGITFQGDIGVNSKENKCAVSIYNSDIFEIYQLKGKELNPIFVSSIENKPAIKEISGGLFSVNRNQSIAGYLEMAVSDELIAFLYSPLFAADAKSKQSNEIHCFNWKGEKLMKYILPFPISNFCFNNEYLFAVRYLDDDIEIYRFKIA